MHDIKYRHNIERNIVEHIRISNDAEKMNEPVPFLLSTVAAFTNCYKQKNYFNEMSLFLLDFFDFFEYSTSSLPPKEIDIYKFPEMHPYYYDALSGTSDESIFEDDEGECSIVGVGICRKQNVLTICMEFFMHSRTNELKERNLENHIIPHEFAYLTLIQNNTNEDLSLAVRILRRGEIYDIKNIDKKLRPGEAYEMDRLLVQPQKLSGGRYDLSYDGFSSSSNFNHYREVCNSIGNYSDKELALTAKIAMSKYRQGYKSKTLEKFKAVFEVARLMAYLPEYFEFMYDLIVKEKREIGSTYKGDKDSKRKKEKKIESPIYKTIKSICVSYEVESETRDKLSDKCNRTWTAPSYSFIVSGHWRTLKHPWSKGHDPSENEIQGKTWISEFIKGKDKEKLTIEPALKNPNVVIKRKQTLAYARDIIKAHENKIENSMQNNVQEVKGRSLSINTQTISKLEKPSPEWIYEERKKLSSGLRWIILKRDNFKCRKCGLDAEDGAKLEIDHIDPITNWGKTVESNLMTLCRECNKGKSNKI